MAIHLHQGDLPKDINLGKIVAVDTEAMGLNPARDRLCLVQLSDGKGDAHLVQVGGDYDCPNLRALLTDKSILKIFHFARFDVAIMKAYLDVEVAPIYCTRTASRLARTYTDRHGLRDCCRELLGVELNKQQQTSDWGAKTLTNEQKEYAASDVLHLHALMAKFDEMLARENRTALAKKCFEFISVRAQLDLEGWAGIDIFEH